MKMVCKAMLNGRVKMWVFIIHVSFLLAVSACSRKDEVHAEAISPVVEDGTAIDPDHRAEISVFAALASGNAFVKLEKVLLVQSFPNHQQFFADEIEEVNPFSADSLRAFFSTQIVAEDELEDNEGDELPEDELSGEDFSEEELPKEEMAEEVTEEEQPEEEPEEP